MKNVLLALNLILFSVIIFQACDERKKIVLAPSACPPCKSYSNFPFTGIGADVAKSMSSNYQTIDQPLLQIAPNTPDASSVWFSVETLKGFIWKMEEAMCKAGCSDKQLGIRIYYARYPDAATIASTTDLNVLPSNYEYHHTVFMVPTFQDIKVPTIHWDFDPWHLGNTDCKNIKTMEDWFRISPRPFGNEKSLVLSPASGQYFATGGNTWGFAQNHGDLIPPGTPTGAGYHP